MKKLDLNQWLMTLGVVLLLAGLQFRAVESFVLTPDATRNLQYYFGAAPNTTEGALQRAMVENTSHKKLLTPPPWLGWFFLSAGGVLVVYVLISRGRK